jgi:hypothetical protein
LTVITIRARRSVPDEDLAFPAVAELDESTVETTGCSTSEYPSAVDAGKEGSIVSGASVVAAVAPVSVCGDP